MNSAKTVHSYTQEQGTKYTELLSAVNQTQYSNIIARPYRGLGTYINLEDAYNDLKATFIAFRH